MTQVVLELLREFSIRHWMTSDGPRHRKGNAMVIGIFCSSLDTEAVSSARMCSDVYRYTLDLLENEKVIHVLLKARELFRDTCSRVIYDLGLQVAASNG